MKKEVTIVPKDNFPFSFFAKLLEQPEDSWIFLHEKIICELQDSSDNWEYRGHYILDMNWNETENFPDFSIHIPYSLAMV